MDDYGCCGCFFGPFTISNRPEIVVELWPLPYTLNLPLYLLLLVSAFFGFMAGVIITFFSSGTMRKNFRKAEKKAGNLEKELKEEIVSMLINETSYQI